MVTHTIIGETVSEQENLNKPTSWLKASL